MVRLTPKDSSILTRVTRYRKISKSKRRALLREASPQAKQIGEIILGTSTGKNAADDIMAAVKAYRRAAVTQI
jgi:hypothetical protein